MVCGLNSAIETLRTSSAFCGFSGMGSGFNHRPLSNSWNGFLSVLISTRFVFGSGSLKGIFAEIEILVGRVTISEIPSGLKVPFEISDNERLDRFTGNICETTGGGGGIIYTGGNTAGDSFNEFSGFITTNLFSSTANLADDITGLVRRNR